MKEHFNEFEIFTSNIDIQRNGITIPKGSMGTVLECFDNNFYLVEFEDIMGIFEIQRNMMQMI